MKITIDIHYELVYNGTINLKSNYNMKTEPWKLIQLLERDNSRLYKEDLLSQYIDDEGLVKGLLYCLDNTLKYE